MRAWRSAGLAPVRPRGVELLAVAGVVGDRPGFTVIPVAGAPLASISRPPWKGPRSLTRTTTLRPFSRLVTLTVTPKGSVRWAAVSAYMSYFSPPAVVRPWNLLPYQEATPRSA